MNTKHSRRSFISASSALAAASAFGGGRPGKPVFTMGFMCDTHVGGRPFDSVTKKRPRVLGTERIKLALELFKRRGCGYVVNVGDVCDLHFPEWYPEIHRTFDSVFPDEARRPRMWYVYAGHDVLRFEGHDRSRFMEDRYPALDRMHELIGADNPQRPWVTDIKGYPVVIFREWSDKEDDYENTLRKVCSENPGKPVFVIDHYPPYWTFYKAVNGGYLRRRAILEKFPQVVHISAHIHNTLQDENQIWQGGFTAVNCGCLYDWTRPLIGGIDEDEVYQGWNVMCLEVYRDALVFRRYDIRDGKEYRPLEPWTVPLPFSPQRAPYSAANRKFPVPVFASSAGLKAEFDVSKRCLDLEYPSAVGAERAYGYLEEFYRRDATGAFERFHVREKNGDYWMREEDLTGIMTHEISAAYFEPGREYKVTVRPLGFSRKASRPIEATFGVPSDFRNDSSGPTFESRDPMRDLEFRLFAKGDPLIPLQDGWAVVKGGLIDVFGRMLFKAGSFPGKAGARFRITYEFRVRGNKGDLWYTYLTKPAGGGRMSRQIRFDFSDSGLQRVVVEWKKPDKSSVPALTFCHFGEWGARDHSLRFKMEYVKVEAL